MLEKLGSGTYAKVFLVKNVRDGKLYAKKTIELRLRDPTERTKAENEFNLLKILECPTITQYYEHFLVNDTIHIIMEYAGGGVLSSKIKDCQIQGSSFSTDQVY